MLQKNILRAIIILFLLLPLLFIAPSFELSKIPKGERGLPVVSIDINPGLPVGMVIADVDGYSMPVYEAGAFDYSVEPTLNGVLTIEVELVNRQSLKKEMDMEDVDTEKPQLVDGRIEEENAVILVVKDDGIGIDYRDVYAMDRDGNIYLPVSWDGEAGEIVFDYPKTDWDVYVPDHLGNILHLSFVFE